MEKNAMISPAGTPPLDNQKQAAADNEKARIEQLDNDTRKRLSQSAQPKTTKQPTTR